jgi:electron transfer flavoprotein alpha subunit
MSLGLLSEAHYIADKVNGRVTAVFFVENNEDYSGILREYGVDNALLFKHPLMKYFSAELCAPLLAEKIKGIRPWLFLMGNTAAGKELAARLMVLADAGAVVNCVKIDLSDCDRPVFYRPTYGGQAYQEVVFQTTNTMLVAMDPAVLNNIPSAIQTEVITEVIEPDLDDSEMKIKHLAYLPADFKTVDVAEAEIIVSAGMGAIGDDLLPRVKELAEMVKGAIGTTRPVVDEGKIARERMIGQTGKIVSPELYLALGISGASHHVGGIQEAGNIVSINRDPQAPIFQNSDLGIVADLKEVLPKLIEKIKQAKEDEKIL